MSSWPRRKPTSSAGLRVGVRGGGCTGFQYQLAFDEQRDGDVVFESRACGSSSTTQSLPYVDGSSIDYVESLQGAGFQVNNPNVVAACGCGSSFRVADEEEVSRSRTPLAAAGCVIVTGPCARTVPVTLPCQPRRSAP